MLELAGYVKARAEAVAEVFGQLGDDRILLMSAILIADAATGPATSAEILGALFDLTPAEARIFTLIASGVTLGEIGAQLGISSTTAKTHLARIYHKTGQNSRAGLVRLAQDVAAPG